MSLHQIRGFSVLSALRPGHEYRPSLDEVVGLGGNAVRVFCGALPWCNQWTGDVYARLPQFLTECSARGLNAYLAYHTEAGTGYDLEHHTDTVEAIAQAFPAVVLREVANEADHPTQGDRLPPERCADLADRMSGDVAYGATIEDDESPKYAGGDFVAVHLDRGRDKWNMVRRVREIMAMADNTGKVAHNQEPIGADEASIPGKREADPAIFYTMGALNRLFLGGSGVFHSQSGLDAVPLGANQRGCAEAFIAGTRVWPGAHRLAYFNVGHTGSPVVDANFNDGDLSKEGCTRSYSGVDGDTGINVTLGISWNPGIVWGNGWRPDGEIGRMPGVVVTRIVR